MKITMMGASGGEVTGSAYMVQTSRARVLVDCGLFQGGRQAEAKNRSPVRSRARLDAVVITHAHLDHTGRLPLLARLGYRGPVFATPATIDMTGLILRDSARLQQQDVEFKNDKRRRAGEAPLEPLYSPEDAEAIFRQLRPVAYQQPVVIAPGIQARWTEAGHILGSASIKLIVEEEGREKRVVFSGDLGPTGMPVLQDYDPFHAADAVFLESTYGNRNHRPFRQTVEEFVRIVKHSVNQGGKLLVPTFAIGRAQLLLVLLGWMFRQKHVKPFPVFLDSPMAIEASQIFRTHRELFGAKLKEFVRHQPLIEDLKTLKATVTAEESRAINGVAGPCMVLAGAGMCNAGRIVHHLKHNLWKPETHVIIVGYQSRGCLGRRLVEGEEFVLINRQKVAVKAKIHTLNGFSAHAGQTDLLNWFAALAPSKPRVFLTHGEDGPRQELAALIQRRHHLRPILPKQGDVIEV
jgi:metallo-beta-lactamase family protein